MDHRSIFFCVPCLPPGHILRAGFAALPGLAKGKKAGSSPACLALGAHQTSAIPLSVMNTRDIHPGEICVWLCALTCMCGDACSQDKRKNGTHPCNCRLREAAVLRRRASICGSSHRTLGRRGQRFHFASEVRVCRSPIIFSTTDLESGEMTDHHCWWSCRTTVFIATSLRTHDCVGGRCTIARGLWCLRAIIACAQATKSGLNHVVIIPPPGCFRRAHITRSFDHLSHAYGRPYTMCRNFRFQILQLSFARHIFVVGVMGVVR